MGGRRHSETNYRNMHKLCCCTLHVHALYCASFCMHLYVICIYICILQLTYVDFRFYEILDKLRVFEPAVLEGYPVLKVNLSLAL